MVGGTHRHPKLIGAHASCECFPRRVCGSGSSSKTRSQGLCDPLSDQTDGHDSHIKAVLWKHYLVQLLDKRKRKGLLRQDLRLSLPSFVAEASRIRYSGGTTRFRGERDPSFRGKASVAAQHPMLRPASRMSRRRIASSLELSGSAVETSPCPAGDLDFSSPHRLVPRKNRILRR